MIKAAQRLAELRLLVGFLGEQAPAWWPSKFFSATAPSFLAPVFARTMPQAQYHGVTTAAARLHDERIGVGRTFHLFRVPEVYEQSADAVFQDKTFTDQVFTHLKDRDQALARLAILADGGAKASEGPVLAGDWQEDLEPALALLAGIYKEAFSKGIQAFPLSAGAAVSNPRYYTTQLQAGLGLIEETRLLLGLYEPGITPAELSERALGSGLFPMVSARRLRNLVAECFAPRYMKAPAAAPGLQRLMEVLSRPEFNQLLFLHTARANLVFADFVREIYWHRYASGRDSLALEDAREFILTAVSEGKTQKPWSDATVKRVSSYVLGCCADYGLVSADSRGARRIHPLRIQPKVAAYLAYDLRFQGLGDNHIVGHEDWQLFGLNRADVRDQLKRLSLHGYLILQAAADVTQISWTYKSMDEVIDVLTR